MRLTFKFSTAGEKGLASIPTIDGDGTEFATVDGMLDEAKARAALSKTPGVQFSSNDNRITIAFTIELLSRLKLAFLNLRAASVDFKKPNEEKNIPKTTCEKRMERGSVTFVRVDVRCVKEGVKATISTSNPREVVGHAEEMARLAAQAFADNIVAIRDDIRGDGSKVVIEEGDGCAGMVAEAEKRNDLAQKRAACWDCDHRRNGYCSPPKFDCFFYKNGRCEWR